MIDDDAFLNRLNPYFVLWLLVLSGGCLLYKVLGQFLGFPEFAFEIFAQETRNHANLHNSRPVAIFRLCIPAIQRQVVQECRVCGIDPISWQGMIKACPFRQKPQHVLSEGHTFSEHIGLFQD